MINWFKTLPVYLELDEFRVIHACWDEPSLMTINQQINSDHTLSDELIIQSATKNSPEYHAIENLLKGPEIPLPDGMVFYDKDKNKRDNVRIKWWNKTADNYRDITVGPDEDIASIPNHPIPPDSLRPTYPTGAPVVFVGHYWRAAKAPLSHNIACVDFSAGKGGPLMAYRWTEDDVELDSKKLIRF
ncbi:MAG: hypothetical protein COA47_08940 [Robiginitomaculum sp.]|nr:MAG: hypothetical protein COA47_08940 [Robiginitomaculum sp.]